jgi:hypothetical protein
MSDHDHHGHRHHRHRPGEMHPPAAMHPSILRLSAPQRLGFAALLIALIWAVTFWATR